MTGVLRISCAAAAALALAGCESTVDAARKLSVQGTQAFTQKGITVARVDRRIRILGSAVVHDANGAAVVVELRNLGSRPLAGAPIAIDVRDRRGASVFRNDAPGLESDLARVPLLSPHREFDWVNDQVLASGTPSRVRARVGTGTPAKGPLPALEISAVTLADDPVSGLAATGQVRNASSVDQRHLVLFAVARRAGAIVAAGRAILARVPAGKSVTFHAYFIGNPKGARISISAPPSVL